MSINLLRSKKAEEENPSSKNLVYWILIAAFVVIIWFIVKGIIRKMFTLY